jgi:hypothetical protein
MKELKSPAFVVLIAIVASVLIAVLLPSDKPADQSHGLKRTSECQGSTDGHKNDAHPSTQQQLRPHEP